MEEAIVINDSEAYLAVQACDCGYDYTFYDRDFHEIDGGQYDEPELSIENVIFLLMEVLSDYGIKARSICRYPYENLMYMAEQVEMIHMEKVKIEDMGE